MCAARTNFNFLVGMPEEVLAEYFRPFYNEIMSEVVKPEVAGINYDEMIKEFHQEINGQVYSPIEVYGSEVAATLFATGGVLGDESDHISVDLQQILKGATSPCAIAVYATIADVVGLVVGLLGISTTVTKNATRKLLQEMNGGNLNGLMSKINDIAHATSLYQQIKEIVGFIGQIKNVFGGVMKMAKAIASEMNLNPLQWFKTAVLMGGQIAAWFLSDGAALIAQLAMSAAGVAQTIEDAIKSVNVCKA
ncbi:hypothetical protein [Burkholderia gladioli]|uniref:hypothetical protein n=1 Tax=Burkholderia gladioli TaxID=28095 RepID=UPI002FE0CCD6